MAAAHHFAHSTLKGFVSDFAHSLGKSHALPMLRLRRRISVGHSQNNPIFTAAILTISDAVSHGTRDDTSGDNIEAGLRTTEARLLHREVVPDEREQIVGVLNRLSKEGVDLILTTGGTGLGPRDVTPEATREVIDREVPGLAEIMRLEAWRHNQHALLSRAVVGTKYETLIVNLPGNPKGVVENLDLVLPMLPHAIAILKGGGADHTPPKHGGQEQHDHR